MHLPGRTLGVLCQWSAVVAACGFAHRHLQFDSVSRHYLTDAVIPIYILHQTLIVTFAQALKPAALPPMLEGAVLVVLTVVISFCGFEAVRRCAPARPLFGLGKERGGAPAACKQLAPA